MLCGETFTLIREGALTLFYIGDLQMFNNRYEDAMNNSKDEEILEDG